MIEAALAKPHGAPRAGASAPPAARQGRSALPEPEPESAKPIQSLFEFWPRWLFYFPLIVQWAMLSLKHGCLSLPTVANPDFEAGGLCGESKTRLFASLGRECRDRLAAYTSIDVSPGAPARRAGSGRDVACALAAMRHAGLAFPIVAKPDIGCHGAGVQLVHDAFQLARYIAQFPPGERIILQRWVADSCEAGIFYVREPGSPCGSIFSLTLKYFPSVTGDGQATIEELVRADSRAGRIAELYLSRLGDERSRVLAPGETFGLVFTGNHCKGAIFHDGSALVTPALTQEFERIARSMPRFHFGRFDVRFASIEHLLKGEFTIIEVNGAGSEATHIWDPGTGLIVAYRTLFRQYRLLFAIAARNRAQGSRPMPLFDLLRLYRRQQRLMAIYPRYC